MEIRIKNIVIAVMGMFLMFSSNIVKAEGNQDYAKEYKDNIYHIAKVMRCIPKTGDINLDYLCEMALFSQGEIDFSEAYVKYASNEEIKDIAKGCIEREGAAVENMKTIIEKLKDNTQKDEGTEEEYLKIYNDMLNSMICRFQKVELTEDINVDYLKFIVIHHEGIINLTEEFLQKSSNAEVKEVASKLNEQMNRDVNRINKYL